VDDLLDVSRITQGSIRLRKEVVDLGEALERAVDATHSLIESRGHALSLSLPDPPIRLEADAARLEQVISNLLNNAAKYTDPCGRIQLRAELHDDNLTLSVRDNGIGLRADSLPTIFQMFSQVSSVVDRAEGGLGIGLALVKGLVTLHGGRVEARSAGLGQGTEFAIDLPHCVVAVGSPAAETSMPAASPRLPQPRRIMVVDDNQDAATSLSAVLELSGYSVTTVFSGADALAVAARLRPDALVLDIGMPDMSGYELARRIRHEAWGRGAYLIALTGWGQAQDKAEALAAGFDHHLTKPADMQTLYALVGG